MLNRVCGARGRLVLRRTGAGGVLRSGGATPGGVTGIAKSAFGFAGPCNDLEGRGEVGVPWVGLSVRVRESGRFEDEVRAGRNDGNVGRRKASRRMSIEHGCLVFSSARRSISWLA